FKAEYVLFGANPLPYHATNIVLHSLNALLVYLLIRHWTNRKSVACLAALLFAVHPVNAEAVSWIAGRKDLLSATFFLAALLSYEKRQKTACTLLLYLLALLAKGNAVSLPAVLLLTEYSKGRILNRKVMLRLLPYFLLAIVFLLVGLFGKTDRLAEMPPVLMLVFAGKSILLQLQHSMLPTRLSPTYPEIFADPTVLVLWIPLLLVFLTGGVLWAKRRQAPDLFFGYFFFLLTLAPSFLVCSKGVPYFTTTSDRYAYLPLVGILYVFALGFAHLWEGRKQEMKVLLCGILLLFGFFSHVQAQNWNNDQSVLRMMIRSYPDFGMSYYHLGDFLAEDGEQEEAIVQYKEGILHEKKSPVIRGLLYFHLGKALREAGQTDQAQAALVKSQELLPEFEELRRLLEEME
ncbi:hypothetical protein COU76_01625, partial [Candidatus Peregrinibacteria bacterium CG10_big_fil_rev_8_21_14_0_10_49_10]